MSVQKLCGAGFQAVPAHFGRPVWPHGPVPSSLRTSHRTRLGAASDDGATSSVSTAIDVLKRDVDFLEDRTGIDLHTPLGSLADAHDAVVSVLNPLAGEALATKIEEQIAGLQQELAIAHEQVHVNEERLESTIQSLTELENTLAATAGSLSTTQPQRQPLSPAAPQHKSAQQRQSRRAGLEASLAIEPQLKQFWYPVDFSSRLTADKMVPIELFGEQWVLFRDASGAASCVRDECAHRACPLSLGSIVDGQVQCAYHGWRFDREGACTAMPSTAHCKGVGVTALQCYESDGMVWVWPGEKGTAPPPPPPSGELSPPDGYAVHAELVMEVPVEHGLLLENLLDLAHAPFTHTTTFAKGWPVPDAVRFHASQLLGGSWQPYPIDMQFMPPCVVLSTIGLTQPGKIERGARAADCRNHLHQMHVCLPSTSGSTRLLYRMSLDFMGWARHVPGITKFWESIAAQVLGEDLVLVEGQQDRLRRGGSVWAHPVPYDKLGVRYRRWRNAVASGDGSATAAAQQSLRKMDAAELLFNPLESSEEE